MPLPRDGSVLYLSILDYESGWSIAAPSRTFIPELRARWPNVTAIELSDRSTSAELDLVRASATRYDAIVASVFVRAASGSGRLDLPAQLTRLLGDLARLTAGHTAAVRGSVFRQSLRVARGAGVAGDALDLRLLRSRRAIRGTRARGRSADHGPLAHRARWSR